ncbi:nitroreductase family protein [Variovorax ureilyticus]|uniref:nitroreductase family protein n=1 Tax=Variovorax ureilyticus TaxID=1836198 RepID=UPI003D678E6B
MLDALTLAEQRLADLLSRQSISPKRLRAPGPDADELEAIVQAALRAPDHGGLMPWRLIEFRPETRDMLARCFEQEKLRRDPLAGESDLRRAREHAQRAPMLLGFVVCPRRRTRVPMRDQWLAAGAALGNLLAAAHRLGYGAIVLSGERCFDPILAGQLGIERGSTSRASSVSELSRSRRRVRGSGSGSRSRCSRGGSDSCPRRISPCGRRTAPWATDRDATRLVGRAGRLDRHARHVAEGAVDDADGPQIDGHGASRRVNAVMSAAAATRAVLSTAR